VHTRLFDLYNACYPCLTIYRCGLPRLWPTGGRVRVAPSAAATHIIPATATAIAAARAAAATPAAAARAAAARLAHALAAAALPADRRCSV
tara:strand:- start:105 stop:377 length:273 start_codon:yes stop_codon:yes gene_type:complete